MDVFQIILLIGVIQGFFLSIGLGIKNFGKPKQNYFFLTLVNIIAVALLAKLIFDVERYQLIPHIWFFIDLAAYAVGPLWYFTILKSIKPKVILSIADKLLLIPILYHVFFLLYLLTLPGEVLLANAQQTWFDHLFYGFCFTVLLVNGGFLIKAHRLLKKYRDAQFPDLIIKGQYAFLIIMVIWLISFAFSFVMTSGYDLNLSVYSYAFISLSFLTLAMAFLALVKPASFYFLTQTFDSGETYILKQIAEKITQHFENATPFLKSSYSLQELSTAVQANPVLTSKAINRILKTNFNDLVNEFRVKHFLQLARKEEKKKLTLWAIAQEAGFGNKVTFYKSFKKITGTTPKAYLSTISSLE